MRLLAWFQATRLGCRLADHPLKVHVYGMDCLKCRCGARLVWGEELSKGDPKKYGGFLI